MSEKTRVEFYLGSNKIHWIDTNFIFKEGDKVKIPIPKFGVDESYAPLLFEVKNITIDLTLQDEITIKLSGTKAVVV